MRMKTFIKKNLQKKKKNPNHSWDLNPGHSGLKLKPYRIWAIQTISNTMLYLLTTASEQTSIPWTKLDITQHNVRKKTDQEVSE